MMKSIISFLGILLIVVQSASGIQSDPSDEQAISIDETKLQELKVDSDFNYNISHGQGTSIFSRIWTWIKRLLNQILYWGGSSTIGKIIIYILIIGAIVFTVLKITQTNPLQLLRKDELDIKYEVHEEDIHSISFDEQIRKALEERNYKLAVRLNYLGALKKLSDSNLISWAPGKSNHEYVYEISDKIVKKNFTDLSRLFEYCWYGGFEVGKSVFEKSRNYAKQLGEK